MNDAIRYQSIYKTTWENIRELIGTEIETKNTMDGVIRWKVVESESITEDLFKDVRKKEHIFIEDKKLPVKLEEDFETKDGFTAVFMNIWPRNMEVDRETLNTIVIIDNTKRKGKYQRAIKIISTAEYIVFHALMIGASRYTEQGERLWPDPAGRKKEGKDYQIWWTLVST